VQTQFALHGSRPASVVKAASLDCEETVAGVITDNEETCIAGNKNKVFTVNGVNFTMVAVEGGTFEMGEKKNWYEFYSNNIRHTVTLSDYYIGETEVTQALWQAVMGSNPSYFTGDLQRPVEQVSYKDCETFINKLNSLLANQLPNGRKFRFPTEAQWEYAARGGNRSRGYQYSGSSSVGSVAWYDGNSGSTTHPVKQKQPNELGLYDMSGNVWEWCYDWCDDYYSNSPQTNPEGPSRGSFRVLRGSSWGYNEQGCRVAFRGNNYPGLRSINYGLRLAF
jgi:formylglycine-generating enzyme required for sulfatase activity